MPTKKLLLINGHPDSESYNNALADAYQKGAAAAGYALDRIDIRSLISDPNLQFGYRKRTELEPDLSSPTKGFSTLKIFGRTPSAPTGSVQLLKYCVKNPPLFLTATASPAAHRNAASVAEPAKCKVRG